MKLGLHLTSNLKWKSNTYKMISKANKRLWILRRLKILGAQRESLVDVYVKQIRSILEFGVPVWQGSITMYERTDIERVQKMASKIILGRSYRSYDEALGTLNIENLEARRVKLCLNFALKAEKHPKFGKWFKEKNKTYNTRLKKTKYLEVHFNHNRYEKSPLGYLTRLLNMHYSKA